MKFKKLRLSGFKSFVDPVEIHIETGLTGVVGPNGCGKSNLLEALRWVMGEASYKAMRGSGMEDVIFSGTANRPARNMAEVVVELDNGDRGAPAAFNTSDTLEISRRIEREAGSAYRINGKDARARDVQLLFADASTGAHSPSLVRQGQISEIISAKPQARRKVLEEAAGISGLHQRRHEAELRLRAADNNLLRLDDVLAELETQHAALKRQARQATRYRNLSGEIRRAQALILHQKWAEAKAGVETCSAELQDVRKAVGECTQNAARAATERAKAAEVMPGLRDNEAVESAMTHRLNTELATLEAEVLRAEERMSDLGTALDQIGQDMEREKAIQNDMEGISIRLDKEEADLKLKLQNSGDARQTAQEAFAEAGEALQQIEDAFEALSRAQSARKAEIAGQESRIAELSSRSNHLQEQLEQAEIKITQTQANEQAADIAGLENEAVSSAKALKDAESAAIAGEEAREAAEAELVEKRRALEAAERTAQKLATEAGTLRAMVTAEDDGGWPRLIENLRTRPGYELALAAALGDDLEGALDGAAPIHWRKLPPLDASAALPDGAKALSGFVTAPGELSRRLDQVGLIEASDGEKMQGQLQTGQRLVSKDGGLWRWDGFTAKAGAPTPAARRLEGRNRLETLTAEVEQAGALAEAALEVHGKARGDAQEAQSLEKEKRNAWREAQAKANRANEAVARAERGAQEHNSKLAALRETVRRLGVEIEETTAALSQAKDELSKLPPADEHTSEVQSLREKREEARGNLAGAQAEFEGIEREKSNRETRLQAIEDERTEWASRAERADTQIATLLKRQKSAEAEREQLASTPDMLTEKRNKLADMISQAEITLKKASDERAEAETALADCDRAARDAERALAETREKLGRAEARSEAAAERLQDVGVRVTEQLRCAPDGALEAAGFTTEDTLPDADKTERKLERLLAERERLGGVNLRAGEEAEEINERLEGMRFERGDLEAAIAKLRRGINALNREGRERLLKAFDKVNAHFTELFTRLFGGGKAELQLTEAEDPLESGLEIMARPPGKRTHTMSLLSGGEQALAAMALIFAVFLTNPSPICVLDEVDAPLDDANVERFCDLLDEMARLTDTRFLIITHHPYTMARMNRLFGVTMGEAGVSQLVSVDLETAERLRDTG